MSALSFLSPSRCVLMIGDEALYIYDSSGSGTRLVDTVPWSARDFDYAVVDVIKQKCKGKALLLVNDMTDQHFKGGQRLPKVSALDKANVLQRKLAMAFPNYPIRGALQVKEKGRSAPRKPGMSGDLYLFAAVPMSEPVSKTLAAAKQTMATIAGFTLLPTESSDMVKALADHASKREKTKSRWAILIGQHMGGGLRQVVTRDGQLAMTRMTPIADMDADPQIWAEDVVQEFKATISYLSRFGYSADDGTDVFVIATPGAGEQINSQLDVPCNFTSYTVSEAADVLGFRIGPQDDQYHADPLHAGWIGRKARFILPMDATDIKKIDNMRRMSSVAAMVLLAGAAYLTWQTMDVGQGLMVARDDLASQRRLRTDVEAEYQVELARMQALGFDVKLIQSTLDTFKDLESKSIDPLPLVKALGDALGDELRLNKLVVKKDLPEVTPDMAYDSSDAAQQGTLTAILTFSFPPTVDPEYGVRQVEDLRRRLGTFLPSDYDVRISKQVADLTYTRNTVGRAGQTGQNTPATEDYVAEITVQGPLQ